MQELIKTVDTTGEVISFGAVITIEGILVVFSILILIMLTIYAMSLFSTERPKKVKQQAVNTQSSLADKPTEAPTEVTEVAVDETELIAVLTAAVAACMGQSAASVNIRSYKKVSSAWGNAAKREVLDNRF